MDGEIRQYHSLGVKWRPKISDMGLSKQLHAGASSFALSGAGPLELSPRPEEDDGVRRGHPDSPPHCWNDNPRCFLQQRRV